MSQSLPLEALTTVDRLRQAATELFAERGYDGTSMADIAERIGIAKASLYNYYSSKDELLLDLVHRSLHLWDDVTLQALALPCSIETRARRHFRAVYDLMQREPASLAVLNLATSLISGPIRDRVHQLLAEHREQMFVRIRGHLAAAIAAGELPDGDPEDLLVFGEVFFNGLILSQTSCPQLATPVAERLPQLWRLFWRGFSGRLPSEPIDP
jgi:TetR/AcrR family transcriptional repressor of nem operon